MLDISFRSNKPGSILIYADGSDGRILRKLISRLGSEERAQNAIILTGLLSKLEKNDAAASSARAKRAQDCFEELTGVSYQEFLKLLESF